MPGGAFGHIPAHGMHFVGGGVAPALQGTEQLFGEVEFRGSAAVLWQGACEVQFGDHLNKYPAFDTIVAPKLVVFPAPCFFKSGAFIRGPGAKGLFHTKKCDRSASFWHACE